MGTGSGKKIYPLPMSGRAWVCSTRPVPAPLPSLSKCVDPSSPNSSSASLGMVLVLHPRVRCPDDPQS
jgi:hypothetical protein